MLQSNASYLPFKFVLFCPCLFLYISEGAGCPIRTNHGAERHGCCTKPEKKSVNFIAFGWSCQFRTYIYVVLNCLSFPNPIFFLSFFLLSFKKLITYMQQRTSEFYKFVILNSYLTAFLFVVAGLITKPIYLFEFENL